MKIIENARPVVMLNHAEDHATITFLLITGASSKKILDRLRYISMLEHLVTV